MKTYDDYIWDLGGTLLDNYESSSRAFGATLQQLAARAVSHDALYAALKVSTAHAIERYAADIPDFLAAYKANEKKTLEHPNLFPGATETLAAISARGGRHFMISHRDNQVHEILSAAGLDSCFTEVVTADNGFARKPAPDSIRYLVGKYGFDPAQAVMIGDRAIDIAAGRAAGTDTVFFNADGAEALPEATWTIHQLSELL